MIFVTVMALASCSGHQRFRIEGKLEDGGKRTLYLDIQNVDQTRPYDSLLTGKNGRFRFSGRLDDPQFFLLRTDHHKMIPLLVAPGEHVGIECNEKDFSTGCRVSGSEGSEQLLALNKRLLETRAGIDTLIDLFDAKGDTSLPARQGLTEAYDSLLRVQRRYSITFVLDHRHSMASIYALYQKLNDKDYVLNDNRDLQLMKITAASLDSIYPGSPHVRALNADVARLEQKLANSQYAHIFDQLEQSFPEISLPGPDGDTVRLSSLHNNVILISFWASWDPASIALNLELKKLYSRYHSKGFEIYQVSLDNNKDAWQRAINFDELPWINVSDLSYPRSYAASIYNVTALPTTFLISSEKGMLGKNLKVSEIDNQLSDLLNAP